MERKRDERGRFTPKKIEEEPEIEKEECLLKRFKMWVRRNDVVEWLTLVLIIWLILTGLFWAFARKETEVSTCINITSPTFGYNYTTGHTTYDTVTTPWCSFTTVESYYSFYEVVKMQADWVIAQPGNLFGWLIQHPVV